MDYFGYQNNDEEDIPLVVMEAISDLIEKHFKRNGAYVKINEIRKLVEKRLSESHGRKNVNNAWTTSKPKDSAFMNSYWVEKIIEKFENEGWYVYFEDDINGCVRINVPMHTPSFTFVRKL